MKIPFLNLQQINLHYKEEIFDAMQRVLNSGHYILGKEVEKFEEEFAQFCGTKYAIGVDNGLNALSLILRALQIGEGDEIIVPSNTYIATALAASHVGAKTVFVECDVNTYNIDPANIEQAITKNTKAIMPVHLYGMPANSEILKKISNKFKLKIIAIFGAILIIIAAILYFRFYFRFLNGSPFITFTWFSSWLFNSWFLNRCFSTHNRIIIHFDISLI
jgi:dTDP-4-amino-4,6-dideoxygalactose transaminase